MKISLVNTFVYAEAEWHRFTPFAIHVMGLDCSYKWLLQFVANNAPSSKYTETVILAIGDRDIWKDLKRFRKDSEIMHYSVKLKLKSLNFDLNSDGSQQRSPSHLIIY